MNNYYYLKSQSKLITKSFKGESVDDSKLTDRYTKRPDKFAYASVFAKYPAFIWSDKKWSAGFHLSTRVELSATKVPYHLAKYLKEGFEYDPQQNIPYEVRNAKVEKVPYVLVIGDAEVAAGSVSVEHREKGKVGVQPIAECIETIVGEIKSRS